MKRSKDSGEAFKTKIKFPGVKVKLEEVDVNILDVDPRPLNLPVPKSYSWDWSISISTDRGEDNDEEHDTLVCYINAKLRLSGETSPGIRVNTLHEYHVSELKYKKEHEELYKRIARESWKHANELLQQEAKGTGYAPFHLPELSEDILSEDAPEWNKRGYIPRAAKPDKDAFGRKPTQEEMDAMSKRAQELVEFIDAFDESEDPHTEEETQEYWKLYAEWAVLNKKLWHFKLIARNTLAYLTNKIVIATEKAVKANPDDLLLRESYEEMKENYLSMMEEWKDEFAKN